MANAAPSEPLQGDSLHSNTPTKSSSLSPSSSSPESNTFSLYTSALKSRRNATEKKQPTNPSVNVNDISTDSPYHQAPQCNSPKLEDKSTSIEHFNNQDKEEVSESGDHDDTESCAMTSTFSIDSTPSKSVSKHLLSYAARISSLNKTGSSMKSPQGEEVASSVVAPKQSPNYVVGKSSNSFVPTNNGTGEGMGNKSTMKVINTSDTSSSTYDNGSKQQGFSSKQSSSTKSNDFSHYCSHPFSKLSHMDSDGTD